MFLFQENKQKLLDANEAYALWDMLRTRYDSIQLIQINQNFIHDKDFNFLIKSVMLRAFENQANELEKILNDFGIGLPRRPPKSVRTPANTEAFQDQFIATQTITQLQENIDMHLRAIRSALTNDDIRKLFVKYTKEEMDLYNKAVKYIKLKGWFGVPPLYPQNPADQPEKLDSGEAYHLWDHLSSRYDSVEITQIYQSYTHDKDFSVILLSGLKSLLEKQINVLEKEMDHFGLPLPQRPPKSAKTVQNAEVLEDELMFRQIFTGMQYMMNLHAVALKQCTTNDRLRDVYNKFLWEELDALNKYIKYGKMKGWLRPAPMYKA